LITVVAQGAGRGQGDATSALDPGVREWT